MSLCLTENNSRVCSDDPELEQESVHDNSSVIGNLSKLTLNLRAFSLLDTTMNLIGKKTVSLSNPSPESRAGEDSDVVNGRRDAATVEESAKDLPVISLDQVAWHDTINDCWLVIYDYVYDCTDFMKNHPGGQDILLEYAGRDATLAFIGTGHSKAAFRILDRYLIGELPVSERLFRTPNGIKIYDI